MLHRSLQFFSALALVLVPLWLIASQNGVVRTDFARPMAQMAMADDCPSKHGSERKDAFAQCCIVGCVTEASSVLIASGPLVFSGLQPIAPREQQFVGRSCTVDPPPPRIV